MGDFTERLALLVSAQTSGAATEIGSLGPAAETAGLKAEASLGKGGVADKALGALGLSGINTGSLIKGGIVAGAAAGALGIADLAVKGVEHFGQLTEEVHHFQQVAGGSAEDASRLVFAMQHLGVDPDAAASAIGRLAVKIGQGTLAQGDYADLIKRTSDGNVDLATTLENVAQHYSTIQDPAARAAFAQEAFGKGWKTLAPFLSQSKDELSSIYALAGQQHMIFSQSDVESGHQMTLALRDVHTAIDSLEITAGKALVPFVTTGAKIGTTFLDGAHAIAGATGESVAFGAAMGTVVAPGIGTAVGALAGLTSQLISGGDQTALTRDVVDQLEHTVATAKKGSDEYQGALEALQRGQQDAAKGASDHQKAEEALGAAAGRTKKEIDDEVTAQEAEFNADLRAQQSKNDVTQALKDVATAYIGAAASKGLNATADQALLDAEEQAKEKILAAAAASEQEASDTAKAAGAADFAAQGHAAYRAELVLLEGQLAPGNPLRTYIQGLIGQLDAASGTRTVDLDTGPALFKLSDLETRLENFSNKTFVAHLDAQSTPAAQQFYTNQFLFGRQKT